MLDDYIEAHPHAETHLDGDVEAIVIDPSVRGTTSEHQARQLGVPVERHECRRLPVSVLSQHPQFRGLRIVQVGARIAVDGALDARIVGAAHQHSQEDPEDLKRVWHHVARFGTPLN